MVNYTVRPLVTSSAVRLSLGVTHDRMTSSGELLFDGSDASVLSSVRRVACLVALQSEGVETATQFLKTCSELLERQAPQR